MRYVHRELEEQVMRAARSFPAVVLTEPRRADKTWLLRHLLPKASHFLLEDPSVVARLRVDPHGFLDDVRTPAVLDEVQSVREVFAVAENPGSEGRCYLGTLSFSGPGRPLVTRGTKSLPYADGAHTVQLRTAWMRWGATRKP
jgi:hypothetical protein